MHKETDFSKEKGLGFYYNSEKVLKLKVKKNITQSYMKINDSSNNPLKVAQGNWFL